MIYVAVGGILVVSISMFACCVAAGKADEWEERWFQQHDKK